MDPSCVNLHPARLALPRLSGVLPIGAGAQLNTPLISGGQPIGMLALIRFEHRPFGEAEIALFETFADQAVIAIGNARLFEELERRNVQLQESHRRVTEALEQQAATASVLRIIASAPTDLIAAFETVARTVADVCDAPDVILQRVDGDHLRYVAGVGPIPKPMFGSRLPIDRTFVSGRAVADRATIHLLDLVRESEDEWPRAREIQRRTGQRTTLAVPMLRGYLTLRW